MSSRDERRAQYERSAGRAFRQMNFAITFFVVAKLFTDAIQIWPTKLKWGWESFFQTQPITASEHEKLVSAVVPSLRNVNVQTIVVERMMPMMMLCQR
jgi:hypothetical protein